MEKWGGRERYGQNVRPVGLAWQRSNTKSGSAPVVENNNNHTVDKP